MTPGQDREPVPAEDIEDLDPGLARARTDLAWTRTALSFAALGAAVLKASPPVGVVVLAASTVTWGAGRLARSGRREGPGRHDRSRLLLVITVAVTVVSLGVLAVAFLGVRTLPLR